jgi:tRNA threonylcarbamoyladenosine biosynthesis protein TsaB
LVKATALPLVVIVRPPTILDRFFVPPFERYRVDCGLTHEPALRSCHPHGTDRVNFTVVLILAFDTSGLAGSVAVLDGLRVLAEQVLDPQRRSAQTLAPAIVETLAVAGVQAAQIRLVATTAGPGSFTGLRVGVTAAKAFAYAVGAEVLGVSTLEVIAHQCGPLAPQMEVHAVIDAQRKELFLGRFQCQPLVVGGEPLRLIRLSADAIVAADTWLASLSAMTVVTGAGLSRLQGRVIATAIVAPQSQWEPQAATIGRLAWRDYQLGRRDDLWKLAPVYLRPSYAEEKVKK